MSERDYLMDLYDIYKDLLTQQVFNMVTKNRFANVSTYELNQLGTNQLRRFNSLYRPEDFASLNQVLQVWATILIYHLLMQFQFMHRIRM